LDRNDALGAAVLAHHELETIHGHLFWSNEDDESECVMISFMKTGKEKSFFSKRTFLFFVNQSVRGLLS
jgi:hypothetical protein